MSTPTTKPGDVPVKNDNSARPVPAREWIGLGLGMAAQQAPHNTFHVLANPVFNMTLGMNPALLSTVTLVQRLWDAMLDPVVGNVSDNTRTRWGRRRPLMLGALGPMILCFFAIWFFREDADDMELFWHLLLWSLAFYTAHTFFAIPHSSLIVEATDGYNERTRISTIMMLFVCCIAVSTQWLFAVAQLSIFPGTVVGVRWVVGASAVCFLIFGLACVALTRERLYAQVAALQQKRIKLLEGLRLVSRNRPFVVVAWARLAFCLSYGSVTVLAAYMNYYVVFGGDLKSGAWMWGILGTIFYACAFPAMYIFRRFADAFGKVAALQLGGAIMLGGSIVKMLVYHPNQPWLQVFVMAFNGTALMGMNLAINAMLPDIVDHEELGTGERREGIFSACFMWFEKMGYSVGGFLSGFILVWVGFDADLKGDQSVETLGNMQLLYALVPAVGAGALLWASARYPITSDIAEETRKALAERRGKVIASRGCTTIAATGTTT